MKIRRYFINNYIIAIVSIVFMYGIFGYFCFISKAYIGIFGMVIFAFLILNRKMILYEDKIMIFEGFRRTKIEFNSVKSLKLDNYTPKLASRVSVPAMHATMKDNKVNIIYYRAYSKESIIEIMECALKKNNRIKLDSNVKALIRKEESEYDIRIRKREKRTAILMTVVVVAIIINILIKVQFKK